MARFIFSKLGVFGILLSLATVCLCQDNNLGHKHRSHAVPGKDKVIYDLDGSGDELVHLDGSGSHSHYFKAGPPAISGFIEGFEWVNTKTGAIVCTTKHCRVKFKVGVTNLNLRVWDNTGDTAESSIKITVRAQAKASKNPAISKISPNKGPESGKNIVSITGVQLYHDSQVYFGKTKGSKVKHIDLNTIVCAAPGGKGKVNVTVVSDVGKSNTMEYEFLKHDDIPVRFTKKYWTTLKGQKAHFRQITGIVIGKDHRYYMSSRTGYVTSVQVNHRLIVEKSCTGSFMGDGRSIGGIGFNPLDPENRLFVSTNTYYFNKVKGARWDNAKIESVNVDEDGCPTRGDVIISGLPVSNHDHGVNKIIFDNRGRMLITVGATTNAGVTQTAKMGGTPESPLSAAILEANYLRPGFNGTILYNQYHDIGKARQISGDVHVFASGVRNSFGIVQHSNSKIYATENGPNFKFGRTSLTCGRAGPDPETRDKLLRIVRGKYYGHPNRNRGRTDPKQCIYRTAWDPTGSGYVEPMGWMESSTNGIIEYKANTFQGVLRGDLFLSKVAFKEEGTLWRAELASNGDYLEHGPYAFQKESGLSLIQGHYGELTMPQIEKGTVLVYKPIEKAPSTIRFLNVYPSRGPKSGGNEVMITGSFLNRAGIQVFIGGKPCEGIWATYYSSLKCTVPPGDGKVNVAIKEGEVTVTGRGFDYEYL